MSAMTVSLSRLLSSDDPLPVSVLNPGAHSPLLLLCDHASHAVPAALAGLGLPAAELTRHIGWDPGAALVSAHLAGRFDAAAVLSGFSRLVIDCNRAPGDPTSIPEISDGTVVPGNRGLDEAAVLARLDACFWPYHQVITARIAQMRSDGRVPVVVAVHSFTPCLNCAGGARPWQIGVLWNHDPRLAVPLIETLRAQGVCVGDNEPYSGRDSSYTVETHAAAAGLPHVLIELRQDLLGDPAGCAHWADVLGDALAPLLARPELARAEFH
ncbi:MAG: N-formylglutamate amidohydrolase [Proteobacteria bacterium]|nr:N-formylglutamate amidohydrolase [Pseudomonadota bacterium]RTL00897.1 MAG: N-formylglutamate amidohydrolase [Xanthomonadales bacterium]